MSHDKLQLAFAGTPELARVVLESLIDTKQYDIGIVFTKPDRPSGRGRKLKQSEVKKFAIANNIPVFQPENSHMDKKEKGMNFGICHIDFFSDFKKLNFNGYKFITNFPL